MSAMDLSTELVEHIVEYLKDDKATLKSCCLVSSQWLACARPRLFHTARLVQQGDLERWKNLIASCPDIASKYLRKLDCYAEGEVDEEEEEEGEEDGLGLASLIELGPLPKVVSLKLSWSSPQPLQTTRPFLDSLSSLEELTISGPFGSPAELFKFLAFFSGLQTLTISSIEIDCTPAQLMSPSTDAIFDASALERLTVDEVSGQIQRIIFDWMLRPEAPLRLRSFTTKLPNGLSAGVAKVIRAASPSLEELDLRFANSLMTMTVATPGPITPSLPMLHRISLEVENDAVGQGAAFSSMSSAQEFVRRLPVTPSMGALDLQVSLSAMMMPSGEDFIAEFESEEWDLISSWGIKERFPNLEVVNVNLVHNCDVGEETEALVVDTLQGSLEKWNINMNVTFERFDEEGMDAAFEIGDVMTGSYAAADGPFQLAWGGNLLF